MSVAGDQQQHYVVPVDRLPDARLRIERLAARAERLGAGRLALIDTGERSWLDVDRDGRRVHLQHAHVRLQGEAPRLAGWRVAARLRHLHGRTVVEGAPGAELADRWSQAEPRCEHCGLRRRRLETYLLEHRGGWLAQVGSGCLRDFTGHDPARALLQAGYLAAAAALGGAAFAAPRAEK